MKRSTALLSLFTLSLLSTTSLFALDINLTLEAANLREARAPEFFGNSVLFSYQFDDVPNERRIHTVQAAFAHEDYSQLHSFQRNDYGVFVMILEPPPELDELHYRLIVDGLWTVDPDNDLRIEDRWGVRVSRLVLPAARRPTSYPVVRENDVVEFRFLAKPGKTVTIVGSFNGWDPFMTRMTESEPGVYTRRLRLAPGTHRYYFMVDGVRIPDPQNEEQQWNTDGKIVSVVQLP